jgi:hypothetical protein
MPAYHFTLLEALLIEGWSRILLPLHAVLCEQQSSRQV